MPAAVVPMLFIALSTWAKPSPGLAIVQPGNQPVHREAPPAGSADKLKALEAACKAGVFSPEECETRRKALLESAAGSGSSKSQPAAAPPSGLKVTLGIGFQDISAEDAASLNLKERAGALVAKVLPGTPAERAGIRQGDILLSLDGKPIETAPMLLNLLAAYKPGDTAEFRLLRNGQQKTVQVKFAPASRVSSGPSPPAGTVRLTRFSVRDPEMRNVEAVSFLIPAGWRAEGGMQWFPEYRILACLIMTITDPQTGAAIEFLPLQKFVWMPHTLNPRPPGSIYRGQLFWPPVAGVPQFIESFYFPGALSRLRDGRAVAVEELPAVAGIAAGQRRGSVAKSARVRYEYEDGGQTWEEDVFVTLTFVHFTQGVDLTLWEPDHAYSFRAPKGLLDRLTPLMSTVISTYHLNLEWFAGYAYTAQLFDDRLRRGIRAAGDLSRTIARNTGEISQMFAESYRRRSEAMDRMHQGFIESIRGVETYRNPYEDRSVQLPSGYSGVWVNRSGEYILSSDAGFNPNVGSNVESRRVTPAR